MNLYRLQRFNGNSIVLIISFLLCGFVNVCFSKILTNSYLIEFLHDTDRAIADQVAQRNGFLNLGPVSEYIQFSFLIITDIDINPSRVYLNMY